jgi:hypothetical protein
MTKTIVRYRTKPDRGDENEGLVEAVYDELRATAPDGFRYATFRLEDGVSFVHIALSENDDAVPLTELAAFKRFQAGVKERCDEQPVVSRARLVGSYGFGA